MSELWDLSKSPLLSSLQSVRSANSMLSNYREIPLLVASKRARDTEAGIRRGSEVLFCEESEEDYVHL